MLLPKENAGHGNTGDQTMRSIFTAACLVALASGSAMAVGSGSTPSATVGSSVFADLQGLGFDLGKFRPDYTGRFPYRQGGVTPL
jgi:hypothetical protein